MKISYVGLIAIILSLVSCGSSKELNELVRNNKTLEIQLERAKSSLLACDGENEILITQVENLKTQMSLSSSSMGSDIQTKNEMLAVLRGVNSDLITIVDELENQQSHTIKEKSKFNKDFDQLQYAKSLVEKKILKDSLNKMIIKDLNNAFRVRNISNIPLAIENGSIKISIKSSEMFNTLSPNINSSSEKMIEAIGVVLQKYKNYNVLVEGHSDSFVSDLEADYINHWELSVSRATMIIRRFHQDHRIDPSRLFATGKDVNPASVAQLEIYPKTDIYLLPLIP